jgi:hypothetical protein
MRRVKETPELKLRSARMRSGELQRLIQSSGSGFCMTEAARLESASDPALESTAGSPRNSKRRSDLPQGRDVAPTHGCPLAAPEYSKKPDTNLSFGIKSDREFPYRQWGVLPIERGPCRVYNRPSWLTVLGRVERTSRGKSRLLMAWLEGFAVIVCYDYTTEGEYAH